MPLTIHGIPALPPSRYTRRRKTTRIVIHCTQTPAGLDIGVKEIRGWHVTERGWTDVGYHYVIRRDGTIERGRSPWAVGAHVEGHNAETLAMCLVGGCKTGKTKGSQVEDNNFTPEQYASLEALVTQGLRDWPDVPRTSPEGVCGHRDFPKVPKFCPSFSVQSWWNGGAGKRILTSLGG